MQKMCDCDADMGEPQATGVANGASTVVTRDQLLAELESGAMDDAASPPAKAPVDSPPDPDLDEQLVASDAEPADPDADEPDEDTDPDEDDEDDDEDTLAAKDPETAKRLATVRKQEQRARESIAAERRAFERERAAHEQDIAAVREFQELKRRFRYDPLGVSRALGATDDDLEDIARAHYAHSKKGATDPRNKAEVERSLKEREMTDRLEAMQKRLDERDQTEKQQQAQAAAQREAAKYVDGVAKAASDKTPLAAHFLAKNPERTKAKLGQIALQLAEENDAVPTPREVLKAYERIRRDELLELGVDPATLVKAKAKTAEATKAGKTATKQTGPATEPTKAELLAELEAGQFD